ncbi:amino acid transporter [Microthyrium microscopicum]|uniref:Amino acid transporter n=1 Tax=Microthyrium microscopicum TaxID=703497 RepID=A0A6A6UGI2_9PEZI|nr:amino acid transporter [Microthyrium microscopicum]
MVEIDEKSGFGLNTVGHSPAESNVFDSNISNIPDKFKGTNADAHDMSVMGKKQVLRRNFGFYTMLAFASTCVASWEGVLAYTGFWLVNGGTALLFWGAIVCTFGQALVYASIAELASMSPTAGGQYHWVSELAPRRHQKMLSYFAGWLTGLGWQVYLASVAFLVGTMIQGLIALNDPTYIWKNWHGTLLAIATIVFSVLFNSILASQLPLVQGTMLVIHVVGFFAIIGTLWRMAPIGNADVVLLQFTNAGGWSSTGLSSMIGLLAPIAVLVGYDCSAHMAEEINDAARTLPNAIMGSVVLNGSLAFIMSVTLIFTLGDVASVTSGVTGYPFIQIFYNATGSYAATNTLTAIVIIMLTGCCISELAASSRQVWSFARDQGLPGWKWLSKVSPSWNIPFPAVILSMTITILLCCINIGSSVALNAITSLGALAVLCSYFLTISCIIYRRIAGPDLPYRKWSLGKFGLAINVTALMFLTPLIFFITWPIATPVTATTMNWSSIMLVGVFIIALVYYLVKGRKEYEGPVIWVKRDEE